MYMLIASQSSPNRHTIGICIIIFFPCPPIPCTLITQQEITDFILLSHHSYSSTQNKWLPAELLYALFIKARLGAQPFMLMKMSLIYFWMRNLFSYEHWELNSVKNGKQIQWWLEDHSNQSQNLVFRLLGHASFTHIGCVYSTKQQKTNPFIIFDKLG